MTRYPAGKAHESGQRAATAAATLVDRYFKQPFEDHLKDDDGRRLKHHEEDLLESIPPVARAVARQAAQPAAETRKAKKKRLRYKVYAKKSDDSGKWTYWDAKGNVIRKNEGKNRRYDDGYDYNYEEGVSNDYNNHHQQQQQQQQQQQPQPLQYYYNTPLVGAFGGHGYGCGCKKRGDNHELLALAGIGALLFLQFMPMRRKRRKKRSETAGFSRQHLG